LKRGGGGSENRGSITRGVGSRVGRRTFEKRRGGAKVWGDREGALNNDRGEAQRISEGSDKRVNKKKKKKKGRGEPAATGAHHFEGEKVLKKRMRSRGGGHKCWSQGNRAGEKSDNSKNLSYVKDGSKKATVRRPRVKKKGRRLGDGLE